MVKFSRLLFLIGGAVCLGACSDEQASLQSRPVLPPNPPVVEKSWPCEIAVTTRVSSMDSSVKIRPPE